MPTGILEVKLGRPLQMPQRRFVKLLEQAIRDCCKVRNAAITDWLMFRRQHPDWKPGDPYKPPPRRIARAKKATSGTSNDPPTGPREYMSRALYQLGTTVAPNLAGIVVSACVQEVNAKLRSKMPYDHDGVARYVWDAILKSEISLPTWRGGRIPCLRSGLRITYTDDRCEARFPLLSKLSGYKRISPVVRLDAADLKAGNRRILKAMASGEKRIGDSQIVERNGKWFLQLCYDVPVSAAGVDGERVLTLVPAGLDDKWPFTLLWLNEAGEQKKWGIGNAKPLIAEYRRVQARRRAIRYRYRDGAGSGHGKGRFYRNIKPMSRAVKDMCSRFVKLTISDIVSFAIRVNCGSLLYREPTMPLRGHGWFAMHDMPFEWANFEARLGFVCERRGIEYDKLRIGMAEWRGEDENVA